MKNLPEFLSSNLLLADFSRVLCIVTLYMISLSLKRQNHVVVCVNYSLDILLNQLLCMLVCLCLRAGPSNLTANLLVEIVFRTTDCNTSRSMNFTEVELSITIDCSRIISLCGEAVFIVYERWDVDTVIQYTLYLVVLSDVLRTVKRKLNVITIKYHSVYCLTV